jgi:serine/threonine protein kinase
MIKQGPLSGQVLGGKYLLGELLGKGGFGAVYKAENQMLGRPQAVKVLLEEHFSDVKFRDRFLREARTLAALDHANIVHVDELGVQDDLIYLIMPYISGGTLQERMKARSGPLSLDEIGRALEQICSALGYAHAQGVVHLDLKPLNLLIHQDGRLLLSDFGLAHLMEQGAIEGGTSLQFGSPLYMAPEHFDGRPEQRSDLYAVGIILYQLLTGRHPFEASTPAAIMRKQLTEPPPPLRQVRPDLPANLEAMMTVALAKQPEQRFQSAAALLVAFKQAASGQAAVPAPSGPLAGPNDPTRISQHIYHDPTLLTPPPPPGMPGAPVSPPAGMGPGPMLPPPPPGQRYVVQVPWQPGMPGALPPGMVLAPPPGYRPPAQSSGRVWTPGFTVAFVLAGAVGLILALVVFFGLSEDSFGGVRSTVSDVGVLLFQCALTASSGVGIALAKSWLTRAGFIVQIGGAFATIIASALILNLDITQKFTPSFPFSLTYFYLPLVGSLLSAASLVCLAYGLGHWRKAPDAWLLAVQVIAGIVIALILTLVVSSNQEFQFDLNGGSVFLFGFALACAIGAALTLLVRPATWRSHILITVCLALAALLFIFHVPNDYGFYYSLFAPTAIKVHLPYIQFLRFFYTLLALPYIPLALGFLLLAQTERARLRAQQAQPAQPAPALVGKQPV